MYSGVIEKSEAAREQRVITVRMPWELHQEIQHIAHASHVSMNRAAVELLRLFAAGKVRMRGTATGVYVTASAISGERVSPTEMQTILEERSRSGCESHDGLPAGESPNGAERFLPLGLEA